jgi:site-specific DNA-methyltransferase (adenine-specific)
MRDVVLVGMEHVRIGQWRKLGGSPQFTGDRPGIGCEAIEIAHPPGRKRWNGGGRHAFWEFAIASGTRVHTTQKPLPLMEALVSDFTDAGELICDPFAGSGTTGVACIRLGRRFVGWEKDRRYFAVAVKRLRAAREQLRMALVVEPMGTQAALLPASPSTQEAPAAVDKEG